MVEDWLGKLDSSRKGIDELAHRYLAAFAPATVEDFASWSGLPLRDCRAVWEKLALVKTQTDNNYWMLESQIEWLKATEDHPPIVRLLPRYDTYLLGYTDRSLIIESEHVKTIYPGGRIINPTVLADEKREGKWGMLRGRSQVELKVDPFKRLSVFTQSNLENEIAAWGYRVDVSRISGYKSVICLH